MRLGSRLLLLGCVVLGLSQSSVLADAVVSLEVFSKNDVPLAGGPATTVNAVPGDKLELIFRIRSWGTVPAPNNLKGFQLSTLYSDFVSGTAGNVLPEAFHATTDPTHVCPAIPVGGDNFDNVYTDNTFPAYVFAGHGTAFLTQSTNTCNYRWAGALLNTSAPDPGGAAGGIREYAGSLIVRVSNDAAGTFTLNPNPDQNDGTFLRNQNNLPLGPVLFEGCTIVTPGAAPTLVSSVPANGSIDARQPHPISSPTPAAGWNSLTATFSAAATGLTPASFEVTVVPAGGPVPTISTVVPNGNNAVITFSTPIPPGKWTRVRHIASNSDTCLGFLPADVNNDRTASPVDILKEIDHLNGVEMYQPFQTDADRSGLTNPADILRVIDMLNGADAFVVWNGQSIPANPCN